MMDFRSNSSKFRFKYDIVFNLSQSAPIRIFVAMKPNDMHNSFRGLIGLTNNILQQDSYTRHLFLFRDKGGDFIKSMWLDRDGFAIFANCRTTA